MNKGLNALLGLLLLAAGGTALAQEAQDAPAATQTTPGKEDEGKLKVPPRPDRTEACVTAEPAEVEGYAASFTSLVEGGSALRYAQGNDDTREKKFVRGAAMVPKDGLFLTVQFDRDGKITEFDVRRDTDQPIDPVVMSMFGTCLDPVREQLAPLDAFVTDRVAYQLGEEKDRKDKLEEDKKDTSGTGG